MSSTINKHENERLINYLKGMDQSKRIVGIYFGSFDPFHEGHHEVARIIRDNYCGRLICGAIRTNRQKPNISCHKHRYKLLKIALQLDQDIYVVNNTKSNIEINTIIDIIRKLIPEVAIHGIIGSDTYLNSVKYNKLPRMSVDKYLVVPRNDYPIDNINNDKFIIMDTLLFTKGKGLTLSSTKIRELISRESEVKVGDLSLNSLEYIRKKLMYRDITSLIKKIFNYQGENLIIKPLTRPFSGNLVYEVSNNLSKCIIKIITDIKHGELELNMLQLMKLNNVPTIDIIKTIIDGNLFIMLMKVVPGVSLESSIIKCEEDELFSWSKQIGYLLRCIHNIKYITPSITDIEFWLRKANSTQLAIEFQNDPGIFSVHLYGDLNLSNILVDGQNLTFIDPEPFEYSGSPAYDYYRFLAATRKYNKYKKDIIFNGFKEGYGNILFSRAANNFFATYWKVLKHIK